MVDDFIAMRKRNSWPFYTQLPIWESVFNKPFRQTELHAYTVKFAHEDHMDDHTEVVSMGRWSL